MKRISFKGFHAVLALCAIVSFFLLPPLFSKDAITIPDVSSLTPFTAETNFMSLEGYAVSFVRVNYGKDITLAEARKLIKAAAKRAGGVETVITPAEKQRNRANYREFSKHFNTLSHKCEELLKFFQKLALSRPLRRAEAERTVQKHTGKRVLLLASNNAEGSEAAELVEYFVKKRFSAMGYEVSGTYSGTGTDPLERKNEAVKQAKTLGADLVINYEVKKYRRGKKINIPGMLIDAAFLSVWNKAEIRVDTKVYSVSKKTCIYSGSAQAEKKRKVLGLFCGSKSVMAYAANSAVNKLFDKFKN